MTGRGERASGACVLVIEDSPLVRVRLTTMLHESYRVAEVLEAASGTEALACLAARASIGFVVLDLNLPGVHGLAVLPRIASSTPRPVVVVLTNDASEGHRRECLALGADFFFDKSREFDRVLEVLEDLEAARERYGASALQP